MKYKDIIKKWGKKISTIALCGATVLGGVAATVLNSNDAQSVQAYYLNNQDKGTTADLPIELYIEEGYWTQWGNEYVYYENNKTPAGNYLIQFTPDSNLVGTKLTISFMSPWLYEEEGSTQYNTLSVYNQKITSTNPVSISYSTPENMYGDSGYFKIYLSGDGNLASSLSETVYLRNFTLKMSDTTAPVISGYEGVYFTNYDNPASLSSIISKIAAVDETDGNVTVNIDSDGYTGKERTLGSHIVKLSASDSAGNKSEITIDIRVVDGTKPQINGITSYTSNMSSPVTEATIRSKLSVTDNYDSNLTINLVKDNFTGNEQKAGSYTIEYNATDSSGNVATTHVVTITNKDDIKPTITGTSTYNVSSLGIITADTIKAGLTARDNVDTSLTINLVEDNYTENSSIVGNHTMTFNVTDDSGNISDTFTVTITVVDDIPPVFWVSKDFFSVEAALTLTHQQIVDVLLAQNGIDTTQVVSYQVVEDGYTSFANRAGTYAVAYQLQMADGEVITLSSEINVVGEEELTQIDKEESAKQKIINWFKNAWEWIKDHAVYFYVGIGVLFVCLIGALSFGKKDKKNNKGRKRR